jgi:hypothetical protein
MDMKLILANINSFEGFMSEAPVMTYGAPVWEEAVKKQRLLRKMQSTQRLINIKIAKAYRTISFEASCLMAGVQPIGIEIEGKTCLYKRKYSTGKGDYKWDKPLPAKEWPYPARCTDIMETTKLITYPTEIFTDGSKIGDKVGTTKSLLKQPSRTDYNSEVPGTVTFSRSPNQQNCGHIYR